MTTNPAFGWWPRDEETPPQRPVLRAVLPMVDPVLAEVEERASARPAKRRARAPYRAARQDRTGLVEAAQRGALAGRRAR